MNFGCIFSSYDSRDYTLKSNKDDLPEEFMCTLNVPVKNQGSVCSCVAHALSSILEYHTYPYKKLSTNFIYGIQKELFNREGKGMILRDACKVAANYGDMEADLCPGNVEVPKCYDIAEQAMDDESKVANAYKYRIIKYFKCRNVDDIKYAIHNYGPVLAAYKWYSNYKVRNGILTGTQSGKSDGHAIVIYGWNKDGFLIQNSWGTGWGNKGKCIIPYEIKFREAYGIVDWDGTSNIKEPSKNSLLDLLYKMLNALVNVVRKMLKVD